MFVSYHIHVEPLRWMTQAARFDEEDGKAAGATVTPAVVQSTDTVTISPPQILDRLTQLTKVHRIAIKLCDPASSVAAPAG
jgi:hypothetical protein